MSTRQTIRTGLATKVSFAVHVQGFGPVSKHLEASLQLINRNFLTIVHLALGKLVQNSRASHYNHHHHESSPWFAEHSPCHTSVGLSWVDEELESLLAVDDVVDVDEGAFVDGAVVDFQNLVADAEDSRQQFLGALVHES